MALYKPGSSSGLGETEFEILKSSHKFLREDEDAESELPWEEQLAKKYYSSLYREFAVCNLKHYKSGIGETTCGNTRCPLHSPGTVEESHPSLVTLELPFSYTEGGENKVALVKVVLCKKCCDKLMWKRKQEKSKDVQGSSEVGQSQGDPSSSSTRTSEVDDPRSRHRDRPREEGRSTQTSSHQSQIPRTDDSRRRRSRSRSPRRRSDPLSKRRPSPPRRNVP